MGSTCSSNCCSDDSIKIIPKRILSVPSEQYIIETVHNTNIEITVGK